jgi:uncharacterized protein YegL
LFSADFFIDALRAGASMSYGASSTGGVRPPQALEPPTMTRLLATISAAILICLGSLVTAQTQTSGNTTVTVTAPPSIQCSDSFSSSIALTGFDVQDPGVADIVLVLDESGSIPASSFTQMKNFANSLINGLMPATGDGARVGVAMFSSSSRTILQLNGNRQTALNAVNAIVQQGGATCIGCGIQQGRTIFNIGPARPEATQFMIVLTDGQNTVNTSQFPSIVDAAQAAGITMLAIGVGPSVSNAQINFIASDIPGVQTAFFTTDFDQLSTIIGALTAAIVSPGSTNVTVDIDVAPRFPVTTATATAGTVQVMGSTVAWTLPSLGSATRTLTLNHQHDGQGQGSLQVFAADYTDAEGHALTIPTPFTMVNGCNTAPVANAGVDQTVPVTGATAAVTLDGSASTDDGLIAPLTYAWSSGAISAAGATPVVTLPVGTHEFTLVVNDGEYSDTDTVTIEVVDTTPPVINSITPSSAALWPPNHKMVNVTIDASATDSVSSASCRITDVSSSEPDNGLGDGDTANDIVITGPLSVELRAERSGRGPGRVYTITVTCTDAAGNAATSTTTVSVPKSNGR